MNRIQLFAVFIVCLGTAALYFSHDNNALEGNQHANSQQGDNTSLKTARIEADVYAEE
ncbi:hypothetical protein HF888_03225 [Bermanella marisrubri]|uniref:Uncharacterized protein n=1 Tax=Bermanella marisrubri TaxID=207949 RepID=Q1N056_9GAMM|nr:hypothetical protein [Bermanella marisrubri]EAT11661.1 hypothetical protein RED65_08229 [Oceanobacter sp. RED65] [Bermanella marisrubri]QIZ83301.1 hypothetical protein HF888_03225 [Bermanella marisrubri]